MSQFFPASRWIQILFLSTLYCFVFLMIRNVVEQNNTYNFLVWNLFLGFLPFIIAYFLQYWIPGRNAAWWYLGLFTWLIFYPNAPYMITDLIHVDQKEADVIYDTLMIFSFSILSLFYGFFSLRIAYSLFLQKLSARGSQIALYACILLSSFGIYLGRILRLNSWDIATHPIQTAITIWEHLVPVTRNPVTYIIIILFTVIQIILLELIREMDLSPVSQANTDSGR